MEDTEKLQGCNRAIIDAFHTLFGALWTSLRCTRLFSKVVMTVVSSAKNFCNNATISLWGIDTNTK